MGELLALTPADFDFQACTIRINKSYQRLEGKDIITDPKTVKSNRMITMPEFLSEELEAYIGMLYGLNENDRIFQISKSYLHHEMDRGVKLSGVKRIVCIIKIIPTAVAVKISGSLGITVTLE